MDDGAADVPVKWTEIWKLFDREEQQQACLCLIDSVNVQPDELVSRRLVKRLVEATKMRPDSLTTMLAKDRDKAASLIRTRAAALLEDATWNRLFVAYYSGRKSALLCAFLDGIGVEHDSAGLTTKDFQRPAPEVLRSAIDSLLLTYSAREVHRYLAVLARSGELWSFVIPERDRLFQMAEAERSDGEISAVRQAETAADSSMEFGMLDRVLIEQVVRAAMEVEGSFDAQQVEELVDQVIRLNEKRLRSFFHLGFMDVLVPGRVPCFERPGSNDLRRQWYLAGVVAGLVRGNDLDRLGHVLDQRAADFQAAVLQAGGPGASIARTAFRQIAECGRLADAVAVLRGQLRHVGDTLATEALLLSERLIRQSQFEQAKLIVDELIRQLPAEHAEVKPSWYQLRLRRRRAQCLQAAGDFEGAERDFGQLVEGNAEHHSPELLADMGLVKGRFRSLAEVRLPLDNSARMSLRECLARGEQFYNQAVERWGDAAPKGAYCLAMLRYLEWTQSLSAGNEQLREQAAAMAAIAVDAMLKSEFAGVYRGLGVLGQAQFMLAVTRLHGFDDTQAREALAAWQSITADAGQFPLLDLNILVEALHVHSEDIADVIAESIWKHRRDDALQILGRGPWMTRSPRLRAAMIEAAKDERSPRATRFRLWLTLVPVLIRSADISAAEDGLSELEALAETTQDVERMLEFLGDRGNYDPAWKEIDASFARVELMRRLGRDAECAQALRQLFYQVRDGQRWHAEQILVMVDEWGLGDKFGEDLRRALPPVGFKGEATIDETLRGGARVQLLLIGGNEIQARYDTVIAEELAAVWPGVTVRFEHSGWSSNWGRDLPRLIAMANEVDAVVLMRMMRTLLGRRLRESLKKPWIPCNATGKGGILLSLQQAARVAIEQRQERAGQRG